MSVLIKGMNMPKTCVDCVCYHHYPDLNYDVCRASKRIFNDGNGQVTINPFKEKLDTCPLVEVPTPHGRLVDFSIIGLPTVIEAEE